MQIPLSQYDPNELRQRLVDLGEAYADADAAANLLEETKTTLKAKLFKMSEEKSAAAREMEALADLDYHQHLEAMVEARRKATRAKVAYDSARVWIDMVRTLESSRRAEMGLK